MAGRPTKYKAEFASQAAKLCALGATDAQLADFFGVAISTINLWKVEHQEFSDAIKVPKTEADERVVQSLYRRAMGYEHDEVDIRVIEGQIVQTPIRKHYPPDTAAAAFWLKNRAGWRDKHETEITGKDGQPLTMGPSAEVLDAMAKMTPEQLRALAAKPLKDE